MRTQAHDYWKLFKAKACSLKLKGSDHAEIFEELVDLLVASGQLQDSQREGALKALADRERLASTGVGQNVAIPHVGLEGLERVAVGVSLHPEGVDWRAIDGEPVRIFVTVLRPEGPDAEHDPERHLEMMRWLARLARNDDFRRFALGAGTRTELVQLMKEMSSL